jgi:[ribosomal protein S18]-alanine N-acetyltransferase
MVVNPALRMRIRRAIPTDIPVLIALEKQAATAAHWSTEQYEALFSSDKPSRVVLVMEGYSVEDSPIEDAGVKDARVQGFIVGRAVSEDWEIENIAVAGAARRRGLGTRLLEEFIDLARGRGAQSVFLEVRESNLAARRLYEKYAFVETGRRKRYYRQPEEDAIVYRLGFA